MYECMCMCVCAYECSVHRGRKRVLDSLELESWLVVSFLTMVLGLMEGCKHS